MNASPLALRTLPNGFTGQMTWRDLDGWRLEQGGRTRLLVRRTLGGRYTAEADMVPLRIGRSSPKSALILRTFAGEPLGRCSTDWTENGWVELADGGRYQWRRDPVSPGNATLRDAAGAVVLAWDRANEWTTTRTGTLPDGHGAALLLIGQALLVERISAVSLDWQPRARSSDGVW